ncbi:CotH kinase family protein [uncultured Gemmiger sp.]|uniref:CotH kinase family protein n=1 Tax=uncultured Gemmiger sp. TaxID=1623490 RepID=UPI0025CC0494|nr:CotH kinase family protein [uncultured Gemmiger sp.]
MKDKDLIPRRRVLGLGVALAGLCAGCAVLPVGSTESASGSQAASENKAADKVEKAPLEDINSVHLRDNPELYTVYDDSGVVTMYLTVSRGNDSENTNHSWAEINHYSVYDYEAMGVPRYQVAALLQVGDENGPVVGEVGYADSVPNATVQIRGQTSSRNRQKNYKVKLKKNKGSWRGQRTIALNKHQGEGLRFRNKMAYDLIKGIDQMMGLRTQFVHLYVKDLTDSSSGVFEDYGLYTQVEQLNKTALTAHGVDPNGQLYKINFFEFYRYEDVIRLTTDPAYDQTAFEKHLEIKGDSDHSKLIKMLDVLNDESSSMDDELFVTYFDKENIAYWMAFQLLTGNADTQSRNVYLYSPQNSEKWYFWDWDNDAMLRRKERKLKNFSDSNSWDRGVSNYWGNILFRRCLQTQSYRDMLDTAMKELYAYMNEERIQSMLEHYRSVTEKYVWQMPDRMNVPITHDEYEEVLKSIWPEIDENYNYYWESYRKPMPFFIGKPQVVNGSLLLNWDPSYNFEIENIYYTVELAKDYLFTTTFFRQENLILPELTMDTLPAGQYFLRVRATNASGYTQDAFDYYVTETGKHYGMICFYVQPDGSIAEDTYEE